LLELKCKILNKNIPGWLEARRVSSPCTPDLQVPLIVVVVAVVVHFGRLSEKKNIVSVIKKKVKKKGHTICASRAYALVIVVMVEVVVVVDVDVCRCADLGSRLSGVYKILNFLETNNLLSVVVILH
jgi:hypothetical protein